METQVICRRAVAWCNHMGPFSGTIELIERLHCTGSEHIVGESPRYGNERAAHGAAELGRQMAQRTFRSFLTELRAFIETEWKKERDMMIW